MSNLKFGGQAAGLEGINFLTAHGFDFADLNLNEIGKIRAEERQMRNAAHRGQLFFVAHAPDLRVDNGDGMERIAEALEYSAAFEPRTVTIHPILAPAANDPEAIGAKVRKIVELAEAADRLGTRIACENTSEVAADMEPVLKAHPRIVLTLDIGHGELLTDRNKSIDFIEAWPDRIAHVHIHDNVGGNTHYEDLHLPLGEGRIDFAPIMAALKALPREITVTFEMPRQKAHEGRLWLRERGMA